MQTKKMTKKSQVSHLVEYLSTGRTISCVEARAVFGIERLASRIYDLKKMGYPIIRVRLRDAIGNRYSRYGFNMMQMHVPMRV